MSSFILRLEQQQKIFIYLTIIPRAWMGSKSIAHAWGRRPLTHLELKWTVCSYTPVVPLKTIADSSPKWAKSIPVFRPEQCVKTSPPGAAHTYNYDLCKGVPAVTTAKIHKCELSPLKLFSFMLIYEHVS